MDVEELGKIVGTTNVLDAPGVLEGYSGKPGFSPPVMPGCVVRPANVDEVQAVVRWANDSGTPLVPVSSGAPHYRGDTVPGTDGAVVVDLSRMDKIVRIDTRNKVVMVEPGVTCGDYVLPSYGNPK
jgi:FAD/FMN-containing dehydrogenase